MVTVEENKHYKSMAIDPNTGIEQQLVFVKILKIFEDDSLLFKGEKDFYCEGIVYYTKNNKTKHFPKIVRDVIERKFQPATDAEVVLYGL